MALHDWKPAKLLVPIWRLALIITLMVIQLLVHLSPEFHPLSMQDRSSMIYYNYTLINNTGFSLSNTSFDLADGARYHGSYGNIDATFSLDFISVFLILCAFVVEPLFEAYSTWNVDDNQVLKLHIKPFVTAPWITPLLGFKIAAAYLIGSLEYTELGLGLWMRLVAATVAGGLFVSTYVSQNLHGAYLKQSTYYLVTLSLGTVFVNEVHLLVAQLAEYNVFGGSATAVMAVYGTGALIFVASLLCAIMTGFFLWMMKGAPQWHLVLVFFWWCFNLMAANGFVGEFIYMGGFLVSTVLIVGVIAAIATMRNTKRYAGTTPSREPSEVETNP